MSRVHKWVVPVDDKPHYIGSGRVVHVDSPRGRIDEVTVWTHEHDPIPGFPDRKDLVQVYGTGQELPPRAIVLGTVVVSNGNLVWHVVLRYDGVPGYIKY